MEIRGKKLELKRGKGILNKVSVSTVTTGAGVEPAIRTPVAMGAGAEIAKEKVERVGVGVVPEEVPRVRVIEAEVPVPEEFMEEGLTSPW